MVMIKKNKTYFKRFFLIIEIIAIFISIISAFIMYNPLYTKSRYKSEYIDKISYYDDNGFDLIVLGASSNQVSEFKEKNFVNDAVSASRISLYINTGSYEDYQNVLVFDKEEDLKYTEFTESRILSQSNEITDYIYADYKFCQLHNVKLGSIIKISVSGSYKDFTISRVYRTDYSYPEGTLIGLKNIITIASTKSQNVYLTSNNLSELKSYLNDYKPMGTFLDKTSFQTDEEYEAYVDDFNSKNYYSSCVIELEEDLNQVKMEYQTKISKVNKRFYVSLVVVTLIVFLTSMMVFFINAKSKKDRIYKYIQENGNKKIINLFTIFNISFAVFIMVSFIVSMIASLSKLTTYYTLINEIKDSYIVFIFPIIGVAVSYLLITIKIKKS